MEELTKKSLSNWIKEIPEGLIKDFQLNDETEYLDQIGENLDWFLIQNLLV